MRLVIIALVGIISRTGLSLTMVEETAPKARLGWEIESREQSDGDPKGFINWSVSGEYPIWDFLSIATSVQYSPDSHKDTEKFSIYQNFYKYGIGVNIGYVYYVRWFLDAQAIAVTERITYKTSDQSETITDSQLGSQFRLGFDYLLTSNIEIRMSYGMQYRPLDKRKDALKGLFLTYRF